MKTRLALTGISTPTQMDADHEVVNKRASVLDTNCSREFHDVELKLELFGVCKPSDHAVEYLRRQLHADMESLALHIG